MKKIVRWLMDLFRPVTMYSCRTKYIYNGKPATPEQEKMIDQHVAQMHKTLDEMQAEFREALK